MKRRAFLKSTAAGIFLAQAPYILGQEPTKYKTALIGSGWWGKNILREAAASGRCKIVALCDVDWAHGAGTFKKFPKAKQYKDYRKMLDEQKDIDAVIVATPDHHHAFASMHAIQLGKHV